MKRLPTTSGTAVWEVGTTRFTYTCVAGHVHTQDINRGKPKHLHIGPEACALLARHWKAPGKVYFPLPEVPQG
jgi:hypothetical protein